MYFILRTSLWLFKFNPVEFSPASAHCCPEYFVMPAEAGIQRLKSLDSSQKHAGMTVSDGLFEFKSIFCLTMSKATWYARKRHVDDYYSGQQCASAVMTYMWDSNDNVYKPLK